MVTFEPHYEVHERPWGFWHILLETGQNVVKCLVVNPGCMLSLQSHALRNETWHVVNGQCVVYTEVEGTIMGQPSVMLLNTNNAYHIPKGVKHRLINPTAEPVVIIENITGEYDEEDIIRYHDAYGRS